MLAETIHHLLPASGLDRLFEALKRHGYQCVGPTLRDNAIVYDHIHHSSDLPQGWTDRQAAGHYRLQRRDDDAYFGYVVGPQSWKKYLFPPEHPLFQLQRVGRSFKRSDQPEPTPRYAFIGVRACEIEALTIQDRVFQGGRFEEPEYRARRQNAFVVAVNCTQAGGTCFCVSMDTGPEVRHGFDLAMTEVVGDQHYFVIRAGSDRGHEILDELDTGAVQASHQEAARAGIRNAVETQGRSMDTRDIQNLLKRNVESEQWQEVAQRCLSCANCTQACPTCFCSSIEDLSDLNGSVAERRRRWDSCFNTDFSYIHGGEVRTSTASRYRQWMTHKLSTWHDQFGSSGCVGCGRCITWCPVGIDITEEVRKMREGESS